MKFAAQAGELSSGLGASVHRGETKLAKMMDVVKVIHAGCITEISGCRIIQKGDSPQVRAEKKKCSTMGRKLTNHRTMQRRFKLLLAANYKLTDFFFTLTFDDDHLPRTRKETMRAFERFVKRLRRSRDLRGQELRYSHCIESKHGIGRYHIHMIVNATGKDVEELCSLWDDGTVDWEYIGWSKESGKLKPRGPKGYEILARYMTKEVQPVGARNYSGSKNLVRPTATVRFMSEEEVNARRLAETPEGCEQLDYAEYGNEWGRFWYVSYYNKGQDGNVKEERPSLYDGEGLVISRRNL